MHLNLSTTRRYSVMCYPNIQSTIAAKTKALVQHRHYLEALQLYTKTSHPHPPDKFTFPSLLKASAALSNHNYGKQLHSTIITSGLQFDPFIATSLINMYVKCGSLSNAIHVFVHVSQRGNVSKDVTLWNSILDGYFKFGRISDGLGCFRQMQLMGIGPDAYTLCIILGVCCDLYGLVEGKQIHAYIIRNLFGCDAFLNSALVDMYMKCGRPMDACRVYDKLDDKSNVVVRNVMITGFCENLMWEKSFEFYAQTKKENCDVGSAILSNVLMVCSYADNLEFGMEVHCDVFKFGLEWEPYVCTSLLTMYGRFMLVEDATRVFNGIAEKRIELWNAMISVFVGSDFVREALEQYNEMRLSGLQTDSFTVTNILSACSTLVSYDFGRIVHGELIKRPMQSITSVQSALLTMYAKCGCIEDANLVFGMIEERDIVAWGSIISGFFQNKKYEDGLRLFEAMKADGVGSDSTIMASLIGASAALEYVELGDAIHGLIIKNGTSLDVFVGSALIDMYGKCGLPDVAEIVFSEMPCKSLVAWNSISSCYSRNGLPELSISILPQIVNHGLTPDPVSITNALVAVSSLTALLKGKTVHGYHIRLYFQSDLQVENALIDMYVKCGCLKYADHIFENMARRSIVTWNSIIAGYGSHGNCLQAMKLFNRMQTEGVLPDDITFLALISACSHSGFVAEGFRLFYLMRENYGIEPRIEHYANMVDLLGRAGYLNEAYHFIQRMPIKPDKSIWLSLLFACRSHRNIVLGEIAADQLMEIEPNKGSNYVQLLNLYGEGELWDKVANMRMSMREKGLKKNPGCSWIEMKDKVHVFLSGDSSSPMGLEIYGTLSDLRRNMEDDECNDESILYPIYERDWKWREVKLDKCMLKLAYNSCNLEGMIHNVRA